MRGLQHEFTRETIDLMKGCLGDKKDPKELSKGVSIATGLTWYDLRAPAFNIYPTITPLRNVIPRTQRANPGDAARWKQVSAITGSGWDSMPWVPEGQRAGTMSYVTANKSATYVTLGEEDFLTFEAEAAAKGLEDEDSLVNLRLLQKMMMKEEKGLLGGNASLQLGTPTAPTLSASGSGATLPALTYSVIVVALTFEGYKNSSLTAGVATTKTITGADGKQFVLNGGASNKSSNTTQAATLGQTLFASTPAIQGALAYAWFVGAAGSETLQAITTINSASFSAPLAGSRQAATSVTADTSANPNLAFDGLLTQTLNPQNLGYVNSQGTGTAGTGTTLTASGRGSVIEIDTMLQSMWDNYRISPSVLWVNSQELRNITNKVFTGNSSSSLLRYNADGEGAKGLDVSAGGRLRWYFNPYGGQGADAGDTDGTMMPIRVHPDLPPGTILAYAEKLPAWYQSNEVPQVAEVLTRHDYYRMDWEPRSRQREYGIYSEEVLAVYATFGLGVINNIANG